VIRETGGVEPAASHLLPEPSLPLQITGPWKKSYEKHLKRMLAWARNTALPGVPDRRRSAQALLAEP
jgi:hypothetical protein